MSNTSVQHRLDLTGRVAVITGGAGHIGQGVASAYAGLGAMVIVVDRDERARDDLVGELVVADLEREESRIDAVRAVVEIGDRVDVLVNCAALVGTSQLEGWNTPFEQQSLQSWRRALEVNLTAAFHVTQLVHGHLREAPAGGSVINVASIHGLIAPDAALYKGTDMHSPAAYAASKGGLIQLTRWLASMLAPEIRVNAIAPGGIARGQDPRFVTRYEARTPLGRMGVVDDMIGAFVYLGSDLSSYVTGQVLTVDGGWTAW